MPKRWSRSTSRGPNSMYRNGPSLIRRFCQVVSGNAFSSRAFIFNGIIWTSFEWDEAVAAIVIHSRGNVKAKCEAEGRPGRGCLTAGLESPGWLRQSVSEAPPPGAPLCMGLGESQDRDRAQEGVQKWRAGGGLLDAGGCAWYVTSRFYETNERTAQ